MAPPGIQWHGAAGVAPVESNMNGHILVAAALAVAALSAPAAGASAGANDSSWSCGGLAPLVARCDLGERDAERVIAYGISVPVCGSGAGVPIPYLPLHRLGGCYVGRIEIVVVGDFGEHRRGCDITAAPLDNVLILGACWSSGPTPVGRVSVSCHTDRESIAGPVGGAGTWGCYAYGGAPASDAAARPPPTHTCEHRRVHVLASGEIVATWSQPSPDGDLVVSVHVAGRAPITLRAYCPLP